MTADRRDLDPQVSELLSRLPPHVDLRTRTVAQVRDAYDELVRLRRGDSWSPTPVALSEDRTVAGVPCRLHLPTLDGPHRLLVWLHGGGWVVGGLDSHEDICRLLCTRSGLAVLQVDYRLAPEHPYPAGLQDALAVVREVGLDARWEAVAVGGDSAGGNLAAAVTFVCRAEGRPLAGQLLAYPCLDARCSEASYARRSVGFGLEADDMRWYWQQYAGPADLTDPLLSPAACHDLTGLPPAVIVSAGHDVLSDEDDSYAVRLDAAGVEVWHRRLPGMVHGFLGQTAAVAAADVALSQIASAAGDLFTLR